MNPDKNAAASFGASNAASARAIADDEKLSLADDGRSAALAIGIGKPAQSSATSQRAAARGFSDIVAHVALHHDRKLHTALQPANALHARLFNEFERARCEAIGGERYQGSAFNLKALWQEQAGLQLNSSRSETERQILFIVDTVREHLGVAVNPIGTSESLKEFSDNLQPQLTALDRSRYDQHAFAHIALQLIETVDFLSGDVQETSTKTPADEPDDESITDDDADVAEDTDSPDSDDTLSVTLRDEEELTGGDVTTSDSTIEDIPDATANRDAPIATESDAAQSESDESTAGYRIYSRAEDEVIRASDLCTAEQLIVLRDQLDQHIHRHARVIGKLSGKLQRVLMAEQTRQWQFNLAEGVLDTARLTRVVTQPLAPLSFKQESDSQFKDTSITLLVDNSKSMLGKPIAIAAACADLLSQTLERCGVSVEILGFTTTELHRGALHQQWQQEGAETQPGRLNGLRHIIYKPSDMPYRRARMNFGVMLMKDLLKQNIDGESLQWAYQRALKRPENRKVLIVISDGAPIDTSTMAANRDNFLVDHLNEVIRHIETSAQVELLAIGIGHDVTRYYQRAMKIMDVKDLSQSLLTHMSELFNGNQTRSGHARARR